MSLQIPVEKIKPSPYQPRLEFDLEDLKGSVLKDGILVPITVRERNGYYELIDGERRTRLARELDYTEIPANIIEVDDSTARRMVWKVNTLRKDYKPPEKARYFKKLQDEGMSLRGIARECDLDAQTVLAHLNVYKLPQKYQDLIWDDSSRLTVSHVRELESMFNGVASATPILTKLDLVLDRKLTSKELREVIRPELQEAERKRVEAAKEASKTYVIPIMPALKEFSTPEELNKVASILKKEAARKIKAQKTSAQLEAEKAEKLRKKQERDTQKKEKQAKKEKQLREKVRQEFTTEVKQEAKKEAKKELVENPAFIDELIEQNKEVFEEKIRKRREEADEILKKRFALKPDEDKPRPKPTTLEDQYLQRIQNTFLEITSWNLSLWIGLGNENREKAYKYFQAVNQWTQWLINLKDDRNAAEPDITSIAKDMPKPIEAEFKVVD